MCIHWCPISSLQETTMSNASSTMRVRWCGMQTSNEFHDATKSRWDHATQRHAISAFRFDFEHNTEGVKAYDITSRVIEAMFTKLVIYVAANIFKLFGHILVVLKMSLFLDSVLRRVCTMIKTMRVRYLSYGMLVIADHWHSELFTGWTPSTHQFHILQTVIRFRLTWTATLQSDKAQFR